MDDQTEGRMTEKSDKLPIRYLRRQTDRQTNKKNVDVQNDHVYVTNS